MEARGRALLLALLLLAGGVTVVLTAESLAPRPGRQRAEQFQRLVGGLGFGPALDLSGCAFGFDPRLDGACAEGRGLIPCGEMFCPRHACSVFFYPPLEHGTPLSREKDADGVSP